MSRIITALLLAAILGCSVANAQVPNVFAAIDGKPEFSLLQLALTQSGLSAQLRSPNFKGTLFAPTNAAFLALLKRLGAQPGAAPADPTFVGKLLKYHVSPAFLPSRAIRTFPNSTVIRTLLDRQRLALFKTSKAVVVRAFYSNARVIKADIRAPKAVVHVINGVLIPGGLEDFPNCQPIATVAQKSGLTVLLAALKAVGLDGAFAKKTFTGTVLAPTNGAFQRYAKKNKLSLKQLLTKKALLTKILTYHVLTKSLPASRLRPGLRVVTLNKQTLVVYAAGTGFGFKGHGSRARIARQDILACRANIHMIDTVLIPK